MALTVTVTPGKQLAQGERVDNAKLNQGFRPTFTVTGTAATSDLEDASVTAAKTAVGAHFYTSNVSFAAGVYTLTYAPVPVVSDGVLIAFKADDDNTGATSIAIGASTKKLFKNKTEVLVKGDVVANQIVEARYDATGDAGAGAWQMTSHVSTVPDYVVTTTGSANAYAVALTPPASFTYTLADLEGRRIWFKVHAANTGSSTLTATIGGTTLSAKTIYRGYNTALLSGDLPLNQTACVTYDAARDAYQLLTPTGRVESAAAVVGVTRDLVLKSNTVTSKLDLAWSDAVLRDTNGQHFNPGAGTATLDLTITVGLINGPDTAAAARWWYVWLISDGITTGAILSASATAPTLPPAGSYTYKALVAAAYSSSGTVFVPVYQSGRTAYCDAAAATSLVFTAKNLTASWAVLSGADLTAFRIAVPPVALTVQGIAGTSVSTDDAIIALAACKDDGTVDATVLIGAQFICGNRSSGTIQSFYQAAPVSVPIRGGSAAYNIQARSNDTDACNRLVITGWTL